MFKEIKSDGHDYEWRNKIWIQVYLAPEPELNDSV